MALRFWQSSSFSLFFLKKTKLFNKSINIGSLTYLELHPVYITLYSGLHLSSLIAQKRAKCGTMRNAQMATAKLHGTGDQASLYNILIVAFVALGGTVHILLSENRSFWDLTHLRSPTKRMDCLVSTPEWVHYASLVLTSLTATVPRSLVAQLDMQGGTSSSTSQRKERPGMRRSQPR